MAKPSTGRPATRWVGESVVTRSGCSRSSASSSLIRRVELVVGDFRIVVDVVALFVVPNLLRRSCDAGKRIHWELDVGLGSLVFGLGDYGRFANRPYLSRAST